MYSRAIDIVRETVALCESLRHYFAFYINRTSDSVYRLERERKCYESITLPAWKSGEFSSHQQCFSLLSHSLSVDFINKN